MCITARRVGLGFECRVGLGRERVHACLGWILFDYRITRKSLAPERGGCFQWRVVVSERSIFPFSIFPRML